MIKYYYRDSTGKHKVNRFISAKKIPKLNNKEKAIQFKRKILILD
jgi:hypothetical protein